MKIKKTLLLSLSCFISAGAMAIEPPNIPDAPTVYPEGELGRMVRLGEAIIFNTNTH